MTGAAHPDIAALLARAHGAELLERAERHRRAALAKRRSRDAGLGADASGRLRTRLRYVLRRRREPAPADALLMELRIRYTRADDDGALRRLAALDSATIPAPPLLVAEVQGKLYAALSLWDGRAIADPFRRTEALVELLTVRAAQIHRAAEALVEAPRAAPRLSPASDQPSG
jgi:hypothetical protein